MSGNLVLRRRTEFDEFDLKRGEVLDQDHRTSTKRTGPHGNWLGWSGYLRRCRSGRGIRQQQSAEWQECTAPAAGQKTKVADTDEPARQDMKQEATKELIHVQSHEPFSVLVSGVSPAKSDLVVNQ